MRKPSFLDYEKPLICAMVQDSTVDEAICTIKDSIMDGADAFGIQLCNLIPEHRDEKHLKRLFEACEGKPIYMTSYRGANNKDMTDEERQEFLLSAMRVALLLGEVLCDVMGDEFHPETDQLTFDSEAVEKQKALIAKIHAEGGKVLMSTHTSRFFTEDEVVEYAKAQRSRGADVVKIVSKANGEDEQMVALQIIHRLKKEIDCPYLFLVGGTHTRLVRQIGPALGVCMYLAVSRYRPVTAKAQPTIRSVKAIRDAMAL
jgi:3-dehydroquinate dehydratase